MSERYRAVRPVPLLAVEEVTVWREAYEPEPEPDVTTNSPWVAPEVAPINATYGGTLWSIVKQEEEGVEVISKVKTRRMIHWCAACGLTNPDGGTNHVGEHREGTIDEYYSFARDEYGWSQDEADKVNGETR